MADLEISNKSLLAINISLEATKHRQAKEIRDLRRKLRESRLILPPRAYRAVKSSLGPEEMEDDEEVEEEDDDGVDEPDADTADKAYQRVKALLDDLMNSSRRALASTPQDFGPLKSGAKVLTAEEVKNWRDSSGSPSSTRPISPALVAVPDSSSEESSDSIDSEDEVEDMMFAPSRSPTPAIFVTKSD